MDDRICVTPENRNISHGSGLVSCLKVDSSLQLYHPQSGFRLPGHTPDQAWRPLTRILMYW
ncbi:hypothetical protein BDW69DRAFT_177645 [Aspergillus filifer]